MTDVLVYTLSGEVYMAVANSMKKEEYINDEFLCDLCY